MKPAEKKHTGINRAWLAKPQNMAKRLRRKQELTDVLDTDEDRVLDYYLLMNPFHKKQFARA